MADLKHEDEPIHVALITGGKEPRFATVNNHGDSCYSVNLTADDLGGEHVQIDVEEVGRDFYVIEVGESDILDPIY